MGFFGASSVNMSKQFSNDSETRGNTLVKRRTVVIGAGMTLAGLAGWLALRQKSANQQEKFEPDPAVLSLMGQEWPAPAGGKLDLTQFQGRRTLVNFWATWCAPCVEELPRLNAFYRLNSTKDWHLLAIAVDNEKPVTNFLQEHPLEIPVAIVGLKGLELSRNLGNFAGALPFSVVVDGKGQITQRKLGVWSEADLQALTG